MCKYFLCAINQTLRVSAAVRVPWLVVDTALRQPLTAKAEEFVLQKHCEQLVSIMFRSVWTWTALHAREIASHRYISARTSPPSILVSCCAVSDCRLLRVNILSRSGRAKVTVVLCGLNASWFVSAYLWCVSPHDSFASIHRIHQFVRLTDDCIWWTVYCYEMVQKYIG